MLVAVSGFCITWLDTLFSLAVCIKYTSMLCRPFKHIHDCALDVSLCLRFSRTSTNFWLILFVIWMCSYTSTLHARLTQRNANQIKKQKNSSTNDLFNVCPLPLPFHHRFSLPRSKTNQATIINILFFAGKCSNIYVNVWISNKLTCGFVLMFFPASFDFPPFKQMGTCFSENKAKRWIMQGHGIIMGGRPKP